MGVVIPIRPDIHPAGQADTSSPPSPWVVVGVVIAGLAAWELVRYASRPLPPPRRVRPRSRIGR